MTTVAFLREQLRTAHEYLEGTMQGVTADQAHWAPPGTAVPIAAHYVHVLTGEDGIVNGMLNGGAPLFASAWAGKMGVDPMPPDMGPGKSWDAWAQQVRVDLTTLRQYAEAVYKATDEYLALLGEDGLSRTLDLSEMGLGNPNVGWLVTAAVLGNVNMHCGEIACLKGLQGAKGYPM